MRSRYFLFAVALKALENLTKDFVTVKSPGIPVLSAGSRGSGRLSRLSLLEMPGTSGACGDERRQLRARGRQRESRGQPRAAALFLSIPAGLRQPTRRGHRGRMSQARGRARGRGAPTSAPGGRGRPRGRGCAADCARRGLRGRR